MKTKTTFLAFIMALMSVVAHSQACVDFETLVLGTEYGAGFNSIGDVILTQDDIPVSVEYFEWIGGGGTFGIATVSNGSSGIGSGLDVFMGNINFNFDFSNLAFVPNWVTFDFVDQGGEENISVNGSPIFVGDLELAILPPGITMAIIDMGTYNQAILAGNIQTLLIGGQEFTLDNVCAQIKEDPGPCVEFEILPVGAQFGDGFNAQGEVILIENDVPVSVEYFEWNTGGTFGTATVIDGSATIGTGNSMWTSNINLKFDFSGIGYQPNYVSFDYTDGGGHENIALNGMPIYVGDIDTWIPPSGYSVGIVNMGTYDHILIIGMNPILELIVGGQEFSLDNICYGIREDISYCIDFIMVPEGAGFGAGFNSMGDVIFTENEIPVSVEWFEYNTGGTFGNCWGIDGNPVYGDDVAMWTSNINLKVDLSSAYPASTSISFDFTDYGGHENIGLNGNPIYVGELSSAVLPPGFTLSIVVMGDYNHAEITSNEIITEFIIGGQEFTIDNICPSYNVTIDDFDKSPNKVNMGQNYPNPFNGTTIIPFTVTEKTHVVITIYNHLGQQVITLTDAVYDVGDHTLEWSSEGISEGMYFYQLRTPDFMQTNKLTVY